MSISKWFKKTQQIKDLQKEIFDLQQSVALLTDHLIDNDDLTELLDYVKSLNLKYVKVEKGDMKIEVVTDVSYTVPTQEALEYKEITPEDLRFYSADRSRI